MCLALSKGHSFEMEKLYWNPAYKHRKYIWPFERDKVKVLLFLDVTEDSFCCIDCRIISEVFTFMTVFNYKTSNTSFAWNMTIISSINVIVMMIIISMSTFVAVLSPEANVNWLCIVSRTWLQFILLLHFKSCAKYELECL